MTVISENKGQLAAELGHYRAEGSPGLRPRLQGPSPATNRFLLSNNRPLLSANHPLWSLIHSVIRPRCIKVGLRDLLLKDVLNACDWFGANILKQCVVKFQLAVV